MCLIADLSVIKIILPASSISISIWHALDSTIEAVFIEKTQQNQQKMQS